MLARIVERKGLALVVMMAIAALVITGTEADAWHVEGCIYCDVDQSQDITGGDTPFPDVDVTVEGIGSDVTDADGCYFIWLPDSAGNFVMSLDEADLPSDSIFIDPNQNPFPFYNGWQTTLNWLIDSATCRPQAFCWLTAGGVKFSNITGTEVAEVNGKGPEHSIGGNVYPSCSPFPGEGGQWNHVAHKLQLHFQGFSAEVVRCGNVVGIEPGSESPVTPYNFIEFTLTGRMLGIKGNKDGNVEPAYAFVRAEDRNEPGNDNANKNGGAYVDRYFIHVYDGDGNTLLLVDVDGDPATVDPVTITGGNFQLHASSCDN
jgi:hypothetical protein